jgi:hypothetical protein
MPFGKIFIKILKKEMWFQNNHEITWTFCTAFKLKYKKNFFTVIFNLSSAFSDITLDFPFIEMNAAFYYQEDWVGEAEAKVVATDKLIL